MPKLRNVPETDSETVNVFALVSFLWIEHGGVRSAVRMRISFAASQWYRCATSPGTMRPSESCAMKK
eukprot:219980-Amphidinium_carterae.1